MSHEIYKRPGDGSGSWQKIGGRIEKTFPLEASMSGESIVVTTKFTSAKDRAREDGIELMGVCLRLISVKKN